MGRLKVSAPGKIILHGEHSVVYGKTALAASLDLRTNLTLCSNDVNNLVIELPDIKLARTWTVSSLDEYRSRLPIAKDDEDGLRLRKPTEEDVQKLHALAGIPGELDESKQLAIVAFLHLATTISNGKPLNITVHVSSQLPIGAGLGSSAAYCVCLASSLLTHFNHLNPSTDGSFDEDDLKTINTWAFEAEKIIHGRPSGIDNTVATFGGMLRFCSGNMTHITKYPTMHILLVNTKVSRSTKKLVEIVRKNYDKFPAVVEPLLISIDAISREAEALIAELTDGSGSPPEIESRLQDLIVINQQLLTILGVNHPALQQVIDIAATFGLAAKLTGAGGGGCAIVFVPSGATEDQSKDVNTTMQSNGYDCWKTAIGTMGVRVETGAD